MNLENSENERNLSDSFSDETRLQVMKNLGYYRMRLQARGAPMLGWEIEDLVETLGLIEDFYSNVFPLLKDLAALPYFKVPGDPR